MSSEIKLDPAAKPAGLARPFLRRFLPMLVKLALFGVVIWLVGRALVRSLSGVQWEQVHLRWGFLATAWAIRLGQMAVAVTALRMLLCRMCRGHETSPGASGPHVPPSWPVMFGIITVSSMGRYIPGRVAGLVGGVWMFRRRNVPVFASTGMIFMSRGLSAVLDLLVAVPLLLWQPISQRLPLAWLWSLVLVMAVIICLHPRVFLGVGNWVLERFRQMPLSGQWRFRDYLGPLGIMACNMAIGGFAMWLVTLSISDLSPRWLPILMAMGALTQVVGLLAVFAPGGLGVSDGVLLLVLGQILPPASCAIVVISCRLMWVLADIVLALIGLTILRLTRDRTEP